MSTNNCETNPRDNSLREVLVKNEIEFSSSNSTLRIRDNMMRVAHISSIRINSFTDRSSISVHINMTNGDDFSTIIKTGGISSERGDLFLQALRAYFLNKLV